MNFSPNTEGRFYDLDEAIYRQAPGVNISNLKLMGRSPSHYWAKLNAPPITPTPAMISGTLVHRACLEPQKLQGSFAVKPSDMDFRSKEGKAWRDSQTAPIIDAEQASALTQIADQIASHEIAGEILKNADREVSQFKRRESGTMLKGRIDAHTMHEDYETLVDIKTTDDASPGAFARTIANFGYAEQAAFYLDLIGASRFYFIAVEKAAPYALAIYKLDEASIAKGREKNARNLDLLEMCEKTGKWAGYFDGIQEISLPAWAKKEGE